MNPATDAVIGDRHYERKGKKKDAQERSKPSGLGTGGHEGGDRRGSAFINVGRPDVKRCRGDLEAEADQHHRCTREEKEWILCVRKPPGNLRNVSRAR